MSIAEREVLIEKIGIEATERILSLENTVDALVEYLEVTKLCAVKGYKFVKNSKRVIEPYPGQRGVA